MAKRPTLDGISKTKAANALLALTVGTLIAGCSSADQITADTTCKDYMAQPGEARHDAAVRISSEVEGVSSPGNPMWALSLDAACGSSPSKTIGQLFRHE
jgi:hypothetical protein